MAAPRSFLGLLVFGVFGLACGDDRAAPDSADTRLHDETETAETVVEKDAPSDADDAPLDIEPPDTVPRDTANAELGEIEIDRACEFEPMLANNGQSIAARCQACRDLVGQSAFTRVRVELLWTATYAGTEPFERACPDAPEARCKARLVLAEALYCENLQTSTRVLAWSDIVLVRTGGGADVPLRGPDNGVVLGDLRDSDGAPLPLASVFEPSTFRVGAADRPIEVTTLAPTRPHECPIARFERRGFAGEIGPCQTAMNLFDLP